MRPSVILLILCLAGCFQPPDDLNDMSAAAGDGGGRDLASGSCVPTTCQAAGAECGPLANGCGGVLDCGACAVAGESCGAGGKPNVCGTGACVPKTCRDLGYNCGLAGNGCGATINCGTCPAGQSCGGGSTPSVCGCTPRSCAQQGYNCGTASDGCGGTQSCGTCPAGQSCGAGGQANVCAQPPLPDLGTGGGCPTGTSTTISGTVYAPTKQAAGYGAPDPINGARVYVPAGAVAPFPPGVACNKCSSEAGPAIVSAITGPDGKFTLSGAPSGANVPLVIQVGRWRRHIAIPLVTACKDTALSADQSRLPRNQSEGDIPLIAMVTGSADAPECTLLKIGIDASEFTLPTGTGRVRVYQDNGAILGATTPPGLAVLFGSPAELAKYDLVLAGCPGEATDKTATWLQNVVAYTGAGGRLGLSHYNYTWLYTNPPLESSAAWTPDADASIAATSTVNMNFPRGLALASWLVNVKASTVLGQVPLNYVTHDTSAVNNPPAQEWIVLPPTVRANNPVAFTVDTPVGTAAAQQCGRVLYSDSHVFTTAAISGSFPTECNAPAPMTPDEKVLEFQLFDLGSCLP